MSMKNTTDRKLPASPPLPAPTGSALGENHEWIRRNHPYDWWASKRNGISLPDWDRNLVCEFARAAFIAGRASAQNAGTQQRRENS